VGKGVVGTSIQVISSPDDLGDQTAAGASEDLSPKDEVAPRWALDAGRRRFTLASLIAIAVTAVPFVWTLWSDWGPVNPLRTSIYEDNFFDLQARALFHGHLSVRTGSLGIEGFVHDGRTYTYFGLFPSVIRMPILLVTSSLDAKLTCSYMLAAWVLTGLLSSMLLWRVRYLVRGDVVMGRLEATGCGILVATFMGGTVWILLASIPYVFNEDIAWSICLTTGSLFALLGVLERPSWGRIIASGLFILCASFDRATTGWACVVGAGLVAGWFLFGLGGEENRRWFLPILAAGLIPLIASSAVNYAKFGVPFGAPITEQVWTHVNAYRRKFLAANHNSEVGTNFILTNLVSYLRPDGLSFSRVFPYVTLPTAPPTSVHGVLFDKLYRTSSVPASTPLLFLLSIWGCVTAFRRSAIGRVALTRPLLLAAASAAAALMLWGYIAPRYLGDFVPFLVLASAVAMADIFRRLEGRKVSIKLGSLAVMLALALFSVIANIGMAIVPNEEWSTAQLVNYVTAQKTMSDLSGHPLNGRLVRVNSLPPWGPAGQLDVIGNCNGFYISNGENYSTVPSQLYERETWMAVERGQGFEHYFTLTVRNMPRGGTASVRLASLGKAVVTVKATSLGGGPTMLSYSVYGSWTPVITADPVYVASGGTHTVVVTTDPAKHWLEVDMDGRDLLEDAPPPGSRIHVYGNDSGSRAGTGLLVHTAPTPAPALCESLMH
jgi:hypothetical protein